VTAAASNDLPHESPSSPPAVKNHLDQTHHKTYIGVHEFVRNSNIGKLIQAVNKVENITSQVTTTEFPFAIRIPRIVVVGQESSGKSSVLSRLCNLDFFPRDQGICTRMPIELRLFYRSVPVMQALYKDINLEYSPGTFLVQVVVNGERSNFLSSHEIENLRNLIKIEMDRLISLKNEGQVKGIIDEVFSIEIFSSEVFDLVLTDLPGVVQARLPEEPEAFPTQTKELTKKYLAQPDTLVLAIIPAGEHIRNNVVLGLIQELKKEKDTICVLTKVDRTHTLEFTDKILGNSPDVVKLGHGYVALVNPDTRGNGNGLEIFRNSSKKEMEFFKDTFSDILKEHPHLFGIAALAERLTSMMSSYLQESWIPSAKLKIQNALNQLKQRRISLGVVPTSKPANGFIRYNIIPWLLTGNTVLDNQNSILYDRTISFAKLQLKKPLPVNFNFGPLNPFGFQNLSLHSNIVQPSEVKVGSTKSNGFKFEISDVKNSIGYWKKKKEEKESTQKSLLKFFNEVGKQILIPAISDSIKNNESLPLGLSRFPEIHKLIIGELELCCETLSNSVMDQTNTMKPQFGNHYQLIEYAVSVVMEDIVIPLVDHIKSIDLAFFEGKCSSLDGILIEDEKTIKERKYLDDLEKAYVELKDLLSTID